MALYRNLCFTINNYIEEEYQQFLLDAPKYFSYLVTGKEVGKQGTPHIQGYGELLKRSRMVTIKRFLPKAHIEARRGTAVQASDYCKKDDAFCEYGVISAQGARTDLDQVRNAALEDGMRLVVSMYNSQQIRVAEKFLSYCETERDWKPHVIWLWGSTGTGKSRRARVICGDEDTYTKNSASKWWDGYDRHENVIIDDFRPSWWDLTYMLALLDRYPMRIELKGSTRQLLARTIVVTSAFHPKDCYVGTGECVQQLLRRLDVIEELVPVVPEVAGGNTNTPDTLANDFLADL